MSQEASSVAVVDKSQHIVGSGFAPTEENVELLKKTFSDVGMSNNELELFLYQAQRTGLDPLARQLYAIKVDGRLSMMVSIDGQRLVAQRTGTYRGQIGPKWCGKDGVWKEVWLEDENPAASMVGVYRDGFEQPVYGVATWKSYGRTNKIWREKGDVMLAKCAEALALRKAFPQELSGLYTDEEMPPADPPRKVLSPTDALKEASSILKAGGVASREEILSIILGIAGVEAVSKLTGATMKTVLTVIRKEPAADLLKLYRQDDDEVIEGEVVGGVSPSELDELAAEAAEDRARQTISDQAPTYEMPEFPKPNNKSLIHPEIRKAITKHAGLLGLDEPSLATWMTGVISKPSPKTHDEAMAVLEAMVYQLNEGNQQGDRSDV